jgi:hypothetical protein
VSAFVKLLISRKSWNFSWKRQPGLILQIFLGNGPQVYQRVLAQSGRWYATCQVLPDVHKIYHRELLPSSSCTGILYRWWTSRLLLPLMIPTNPKFAKFLPDGTILYIFANRDSIVFDYNTNTAKPLAPPAPFHASLAKMTHSFSCPCSLQSSLSVAEIMVCGSACLNLSAQSARLALPYVADHGCRYGWRIMHIHQQCIMGYIILLPSQEVLTFWWCWTGVSSFLLDSWR